MLTTMTDAAKQLGMQKQRLYEKVKEGIVTAKKTGGVVLIDTEQARQELAVTGYFYHREKYRRTRAARIASQGQQDGITEEN